MRSSSLERTRCSKEAHFGVEPGSQQIYQLGGVLHDFSGLPAASGRWIPGLPTGDGSAALEPPCEGKKNGKFTARKKGLERCPLLRHRLRRAGRGDDRMHSLF